MNSLPFLPLEEPEHPFEASLAATRHPRARGGSARGRETPAMTVRDVVRFAIRHGYIQPGAQLDEDEVGRSLHASRAAVRTAFQMLVDEGSLKRRPRSGTRVEAPPVIIDLLGMFPVDSGNGPMVSVLTKDHVVPPPPLIAQTLGVSDAHLLLRKYVCSVGDRMIAIRSSYRQRQYTERGNPAPQDDIEGWFSEVFGVPFGSVATTIEYTTADAASARDLGVAEGAPLLVREQIFSDADGTPREIAFLQVLADRVAFTTRA
jgi:GntR family transcriptional regulator